MTDVTTTPAVATEEEMTNLLRRVFGEEILVPTQQSLRNHPKTPHAWNLNYNNTEIYFSINLPTWHRATFIATLRKKLAATIEAKSPTIRTKLPPAAEIICGLNLQIEHLRALAENNLNLLAAHNDIKSIMKDALDHETAWINLQKLIPARADQFLLGHPKNNPQPGIHFVFGESPARFEQNRILELLLIIREPNGIRRQPDFISRFENNPRDVEDYILNRATALGIDQFFSYRSYHAGTPGAIDEERLLMRATSIEDLWLKMDQLQQPETLEKVQSFLLFLITQAPIRALLDKERVARQPLMEFLDANYPVDGLLWGSEERKTLMTTRHEQFDIMEATPAHQTRKAAFEELIPETNSTFGDKTTVGDVLATLQNPPEHLRLYAEEYKTALLKFLPLLARGFPEPAAPTAVLQQAAPLQPKQG